MPRVVTLEQTVEIARPAADVFAFLTDVERLPEWQSTVSEVSVEGPLAEGTRIHDVREFMGRRAASTLEVSQLENPHAFALRVVEGPVRYEIDHELEEHEGRTRVTVRARAEVPGLLGLAARPLLKGAERQLRADLERLRSVLER
jgi:carbon monoxide dehydrogenase subunit G